MGATNANGKWRKLYVGIMSNTNLVMSDILELTIPQLEDIIEEIIGDSQEKSSGDKLVGMDAIKYLQQMQGKL